VIEVGIQRLCQHTECGLIYLNSWNVKPINFIFFLSCACNRCKKKEKKKKKKEKKKGNTPTGPACENMHKKTKGNANTIASL
jgi:hypothetical protein